MKSSPQRVSAIYLPILEKPRKTGKRYLVGINQKKLLIYHHFLTPMQKKLLIYYLFLTLMEKKLLIYYLFLLIYQKKVGRTQKKVGRTLFILKKNPTLYIFQKKKPPESGSL